MGDKKISIVIPAHNEEDVIERCIQSVLDQTYQNFEIIVSNDGSKDATREIVEKLIKKDKRIKILNRPQGHSAAFARNRGAENVKGDIIVFLDADCTINRVFLDEVHQKFKEYKEIDSVISICLPIRETFMSKVLSGFLAPPFKLKLKEGKIYDKRDCDEAGCMFFCISKNAYKKIKGYGEETFYYEDEAFVRKFYEHGFKSTLSKKAVQYFELPSTFKEFLRQCKWIGKGTNTVKEKKQRKKQRMIWYLKALFLIFPLFFLFSKTFFIYTLGVTVISAYLSLVLRNRKPLLSLIVLPFLYIKTILVTFNILRFR